MKFMVGQIVATPGCVNFCDENQIDLFALLRRHMDGDFGDLCTEDKEANERAISNGSRILSSYKFPAGPVWIITEARNDIGIRESTCCLLPGEY
jgi:hypothetical protein